MFLVCFVTQQSESIERAITSIDLELCLQLTQLLAGNMAQQLIQGKRGHKNIAQKPHPQALYTFRARGEGSPQEPPQKVVRAKEALKVKEVRVAPSPAGHVEDHIVKLTVLEDKTQDHKITHMCFRCHALRKVLAPYCFWGKLVWEQLIVLSNQLLPCSNCQCLSWSLSHLMHLHLQSSLTPTTSKEYLYNQVCFSSAAPVLPRLLQSSNWAWPWKACL